MTLAARTPTARTPTARTSTPLADSRCPRLTDAVAAATATLGAAGVPSPRVDAESLAAHVVGVPRWRLRWTEPPAGFAEAFGALVARRARREPLQHLLGTAAFGPITVAVGPGVFTPRPETEALLAWAEALPLPDAAVVVDCCTGSGALALALHRVRPRARILAVDDDAEALRWARRNAAGTRVEVVGGDVTAPRLLPDLEGAVDLVVANPPYVPDAAPVAPEVADWDPAHAVFAGPDGMAVIPGLLRTATRWLRPGGWLAVEHDDTTAAATVEAVRATGGYVDVTARHDDAGRARFVTARRDPGESR